MDLLRREACSEGDRKKQQLVLSLFCQFQRRREEDLEGFFDMSSLILL